MLHRHVGKHLQYTILRIYSISHDNENYVGLKIGITECAIQDIVTWSGSPGGRAAGSDAFADSIEATP